MMTKNLRKFSFPTPDSLSDQELQKLFQQYLPPIPLPEEIHNRLTKLVLNELTSSIKTTPVARSVPSGDLEDGNSSILSFVTIYQQILLLAAIVLGLLVITLAFSPG